MKIHIPFNYFLLGLFSICAFFAGRMHETRRAAPSGGEATSSGSLSMYEELRFDTLDEAIVYVTSRRDGRHYRITYNEGGTWTIVGRLHYGIDWNESGMFIGPEEAEK